MINTSAIPPRFSKVTRTDKEQAGETFQAVIPEYETHWETDETYQIWYGKSSPDSDWYVEMYDNDLQQVVRSPRGFVRRRDAESMAIGIMWQLVTTTDSGNKDQQKT
jgi:hypothetical protein